MNKIFSKFLISLYTSASQKCLTNIQSVDYMCTNCILVVLVPCGFTFKVNLTMSVSKNTLKKKIGHHACIGDIMCQTYPIYACTGKNHSHHFIGPQYILLQLEARVFKGTLKNNLIERKIWANGTTNRWFVGKLQKCKGHWLKLFLELYLPRL